MKLTDATVSELYVPEHLDYTFIERHEDGSLTTNCNGYRRPYKGVMLGRRLTSLEAAMCGFHHCAFWSGESLARP